MGGMNLYVAPRIASGGASAAERLLQDAVTRLCRRPRGWRALVLRLSRLRPPSPRPHHRRVARALLEDAGRGHDGQVFAMRNGDLVLLCRAPALRPASGVTAESLPGMLGRLLGAEAPAAAEIISVWKLAEASDATLAYVAARLADRLPTPAALAAVPIQGSGIDGIVALAETRTIAEILHRRAAIM